MNIFPRMGCWFPKDYMRSLHSWMSRVEFPHGSPTNMCVRAYVRACGYTWNACLDITREKRYAVRLSTYLLLGDSWGIDLRTRAVSHICTRGSPDICVHLRVYYAGTRTARYFNSIKAKRPTLLPPHRISSRLLTRPLNNSPPYQP